MGFDIATLNPAYRDRILKGQMSQNEPLMEQMFGIKPTSQVSGEVPYLDSKFTTGSTHVATKTLIALDGKADSTDNALSSAAFRIKGKYAKRGHVHKTAVSAMADASNEDIVDVVAESAVVQVAVAIDVDGAAYLKNTTVDGVTVNIAYAATAVWSDKTNARPMTDLDALFDGVGNADIFVLGRNYARELAGLPGVMNSVKLWDGVDSRVTMGRLAGWIQDHYDVESIYIGGKHWSNSANIQAAGTFTRIFDDTIWAGKKDHLMLVEMEALRKFRVWTDEDTDTHYAELVRYLTFARGELKMGGRISAA
jgi:hypothetical protein